MDMDMDITAPLPAPRRIFDEFGGDPVPAWVNERLRSFDSNPPHDDSSMQGLLPAILNAYFPAHENWLVESELPPLNQSPVTASNSETVHTLNGADVPDFDFVVCKATEDPEADVAWAIWELNRGNAKDPLQIARYEQWARSASERHWAAGQHAGVRIILVEGNNVTIYAPSEDSTPDSLHLVAIGDMHILSLGFHLQMLNIKEEADNLTQGSSS